MSSLTDVPLNPIQRKRMTLTDAVHESIEEDRARLSGSASVARLINPGNLADAHRLGKTFGVDPKVYLDPTPEPPDTNPLSDEELFALADKNPPMGRWLSQPTNLAAVKDDLPSLHRIATALRGPKEQGFLADLADAHETGWEQVSVADEATAVTIGKVDRPEGARRRAVLKRKIAAIPVPGYVTGEFAEAEAAAAEKEAAAAREIDAVGAGRYDPVAFLEKMMVSLFYETPVAAAHPKAFVRGNVENLPFMYKPFVGGITAAAVGAALTGGTASVPMGLTAGFMGETVNEYGAWVDQEIDARLTREGKALDDEGAILAVFNDEAWMKSVQAEALRKGIVTSLIDTAAMALPGGSVLLKRGVGELGTAAAVRIAKELPKAGLINAAGNILSEGGGVLAAEGEIAPERLPSIGQEGVYGIGGEAMTHVTVGSVAKTLGMTRGAVVELASKALQAERDGVGATEIAETFAKAPSAKRLPAAMLNIIKMVAGDHGIDDVWIPKETFAAAYSAAHDSPLRAAKDITAGGEQAYRDSERTGFIRLPFEDVVSKVYGTPAWDSMFPDMRFRDQGLSIEEGIEGSERLSKAAQDAAKGMQEQAELLDERTALEDEAATLEKEEASLEQPAGAEATPTPTEGTLTPTPTQAEGVSYTPEQQAAIAAGEPERQAGAQQPAARAAEGVQAAPEQPTEGAQAAPGAVPARAAPVTEGAPAAAPGRLEAVRARLAEISARLVELEQPAAGADIEVVAREIEDITGRLIRDARRPPAEARMYATLLVKGLSVIATRWGGQPFETRLAQLKGLLPLEFDYAETKEQAKAQREARAAARGQGGQATAALAAEAAPGAAQPPAEAPAEPVAEGEPEAPEVVSPPPAHAARPAPPPVATPPSYGAGNTVFTADAAARAREVLRRKLNQANMGLDPELLQAGVTLAGYHIEAGARRFADFVTAMVGDLGESVRPYLRSWYEAARHYPGFDTTGMTPGGEIDAPAVTEPAPPKKGKLVPRRRPDGSIEWTTAPVIVTPQLPPPALGPLVIQPLRPGAPAEVIPEPPPAVPPSGDAKADRLRAAAVKLAQGLSWGTPLTWQGLQKLADVAFGGTMADGTYTAQDLANAAEYAVNQAIASEPNALRPATIAGRIQAAESYSAVIPTQTRRSGEKVAFQQFSTPPEYAAVLAWLAQVKAGDAVLEPSAGTGSIAVHALREGAAVTVNEIDTGRAALLAELGFTDITREDGEQLDNILPPSKTFDVVVMNPPFSAAGQRGVTKDLMVGANHIEQALKRLRPGGRLVAIVGRGMAFEAPTFTGWWKRIQQQYTVQANVAVHGDIYRRQGTTFETRLLVIDNTGPTALVPATGQADTLEQLAAVLQSVRDARPRVERPAEPARPGGAAGAPGGGPRPDVRPVRPAGERGPGAAPSGGPPGPVAVPGEPGSGAAATEPGRPGGVRGPAPVGAEPAGEAAAGGGVGGVGVPPRADVEGEPVPAARPEPTSQPRVEPAAAPPLVQDQADLDADSTAIYETYRVQAQPFAESRPSDTPLVESSAMRSVPLPTLTYTPSLSGKAVEWLYQHQVEQIAYIGQAHSEILPDGTRKAFFGGDGTGAGKGSIAAGTILDNWNQGRRKAVWISKNKGLLRDAMRDWTDVGGDPEVLIGMHKLPTDRPIKLKEGVLFLGYDTLKGKKDEYNDATGELIAAAPNSRMQALKAWLPANFDGVIVFDEAHLMGNTLAVRGKRGVTEPAKRAIAGWHLRKSFPNARILLLSATGATEVSNLGYLERLGLWGPGRPFGSAIEFVAKMAAGGLANMEMIARELKQMGLYMARTLSLKGVTFERHEHPLSEEQRVMYDRVSEAWRIVHRNFTAALKNTKASRTAKASAMAQYWSTNLRFFEQMMISAQMPAVLDDLRADLAAGHSVVVQMVNHYQGRVDRALAGKTRVEEDDEDGEIVDIDVSPKDDLIDMVRKSFPVQQYQVQVDPNTGKKVSVPVFDAQGNPVLNREAVAAREALIADLNELRIPMAPLDFLMQELGVENVSEVTGRSKRLVRDRDGQQRLVSKPSNESEVIAFQEGKKRVLLFTMAGNTGASYHADLRAKNQQLRRHHVVQAGFVADSAIQGFGRTHRNNQRQAPEYVLHTTDLPGHRRFISSIARRIEQLGALSKGQRQAGASVFNEKDNLEGPYGNAAVRALMEDIAARRVEGFPPSVLEKELGLTGLINPETGQLAQDKIPEVPRFLNRMLSTPVARQGQWFEQFDRRMGDLIEQAIQRGDYDPGLQVLKAKEVTVDNATVVRTDEKTGAQTVLYQLNVTHDRPRTDWPTIRGATELEDFYVNVQSGKVWSAGQERQSTNKRGMVEMVRPLYGPSGRGSTVSTFELSQGYRKVASEAEAEQLWNQRYDETPAIREEKVHLLTGTLLPIWDRLPDKGKVWRVTLNDRTRLLGREIDERDVDATLEKLGVNRAKITMPPAEVGAKVLAGQKVTLSNGWTLARSKVAGDWRIEITGPTFASMRNLEKAGVFMEEHQYKRRYYVPTGEGMERALTAVLLGQDIIRVGDDKTLYQEWVDNGETELYQSDYPSPAPRGDWPRAFWYAGKVLHDTGGQMHEDFAAANPAAFGPPEKDVKGADSAIAAGGVRLSYFDKYGALNIEFDSRVAGFRTVQDAVSSLPEGMQRAVKNAFLQDVSKSGRDSQAETTINDLLVARRFSDLVRAGLFQEDVPAGDVPAKPPRGALTLPSSRLPVYTMTFYKDANYSTFAHELGHYFLEVLGTVAEQPDAPEQLKADYATLLKHLGASSREDLQREHHEAFARLNEQYAFEGKSPSAALRRILAAFRDLMVQVYRTVKGLGIEINPEIRAVMDRMYATDEEIASLAAEEGSGPIFETAEAAGMTPEEFEGYTKAVQQAKDAATQRLNLQLLADQSAARRRQRKEKLEQIRRQVERTWESSPPAIAHSMVTTGKLPDGTAHPTIAGPTKLDRAAAAEEYGKSSRIFKDLDAMGALAEGGMEPSGAAETFGANSTEELAAWLIGGQNKDAMIATVARQKLATEHPELLSRKERREAAQEAVNGPELSEALYLEYRALVMNDRRQAAGAERRAAAAEEKVADAKARAKAEAKERRAAFASIPKLQDIRKEAAMIVNGSKVGALVPWAYLRSAGAMSTKSGKAAAAGKWTEAAEFKKAEILNREAYRIALSISEGVQEDRNFAAALSKNRWRELLIKASPSNYAYADQVYALLSRFGMAYVSPKALARKSTLETFVNGIKDDGFMVVPAPWLLKETNSKPWRELTVEEFGDVIDAARGIAIAAQNAQRLMTEGRESSLADRAEALAGAVAESRGVKPEESDDPARLEAFKIRQSSKFDQGTKASTFARLFDQGKDAGPWQRFYMRMLNKAADAETRRMREDTREYLAIKSRHYTRAERWAMNKPRDVGGAKLSHAQLLNLVSLYGSKTGRQRVLFRFPRAVIDAALTSLSSNDVRFLNDRFAFFDRYFPEIAAMEAEFKGAETKRVEAVPFTVQTTDGDTLEVVGGYHRIDYKDAKGVLDSDQDAMAQALTGQRLAYLTRQGHTKQRMDVVLRPVHLSERVVLRGIYQVVHDLSFRPALVDARRLLNNYRVKDAIEAHYGNQAWITLDAHLKVLGAGSSAGRGPYEHGVANMRYAAVVSRLGLRVATAAKQYQGLRLSLIDIGPKHMLLGQSKWLEDPGNTFKWIASVSPFMVNQLQGGWSREVSELQSNAPDHLRTEAVHAAFTFTTLAQYHVNAITFLGQYSKSMEALADSPLSVEAKEKEAVTQAEEAVRRTQGSGHPVDLSQFEVGNPWMRLFTTFYTDASLKLQHTRLSWAKFAKDDPLGWAGFVASMLVTYSTPALLTLLGAALFGGKRKKDDDWLVEFGMRTLGEVIDVSPWWRQASGFVLGYLGGGIPAGAAAPAELGKAVYQLKQPGEKRWDKAAWRAYINASSMIAGFPGQVFSDVSTAWEQLNEGEVPSGLIGIKGKR